MAKKDEISGQIIINKLSFWGFLENLFKKKNNKYKITKEDREESAKVKALKKQISTLEQINDSYVIEIENLIKNGSKEKETIEEKMINMASNFFLSNSKNKGHQQTLTGVTPPALESGKDYSDQELKVIIKNINPKFKKIAKDMRNEDLAPYVKDAYPDMSDTSIQKGIIMIKEEK